LADDPTAQRIAETSGIPAEKLARMANSVVSIKVSALKPSS
jgi:hypothetical protein